MLSICCIGEFRTMCTFFFFGYWMDIYLNVGIDTTEIIGFVVLENLLSRYLRIWYLFVPRHM